MDAKRSREQTCESEDQIIIICATSMHTPSFLAAVGALALYSTSALGVNVAEGPIHRAHGISLSDVGERSLEHGSQGHGIIECAVATGRVVEEGESVCKSELAVLDILVLPDPPDAIDLGVMNCISVRDYLLVAVM